jgi:dTDP-4-amino-4,6-dideoxygalactose transaminase
MPPIPLRIAEIGEGYSVIPFLDLKIQYQQIKPEIDAAVARVIESAQFVLGPEVAAFEERFAAYCGTKYCIALNSGTSALHLALLAAGIGPGDEVITVSMTFAATTAAILYCGAKPVFVDVDPDTWNMDPNLVAAAVTPRTKAVLPVHLHGLMAEMDPIIEVARRHGLVTIEDAAQSHGAQYKGRGAGSIGDIGCFSFYPGKNLGAYGEGGAAVTDDPRLARKITLLRDWGQETKYSHIVSGYNYRMDAIQGSVLRVKMDHIEEWTKGRRTVAEQYDHLLADRGCQSPSPLPHHRHVYHVYAIRVADRDQVQTALHSAGIGTGIHYPIPVHLQKAYADLGYWRGDLPVTEAVADQFLSLPIYAELRPDQVAEVVRELDRVRLVEPASAVQGCLAQSTA